VVELLEIVELEKSFFPSNTKGTDESLKVNPSTSFPVIGIIFL
jgi:hypothetical protein